LNEDAVREGRLRRRRERVRETDYKDRQKLHAEERYARLKLTLKLHMLAS